MDEVSKKLDEGVFIELAITTSKSILRWAEACASRSITVTNSVYRPAASLSSTTSPGTYSRPFFSNVRTGLIAPRAGQGGANILNNQADPRQNRARGDFDRPHRFVVSYAWEIPVPKREGFLSNLALQGWSLSGVVTFQNGLPFSIFDSNSGTAFGLQGNGTGMLICRPMSEQINTPLTPTCTPGQAVTSINQILTTGRIQDRLDHFLNPNFVSSSPNVPNAAGTATGFGNIPRNSFRAPYQQNWDFSIAKRFSFAERHAVQFRAEFFNIWNHPIFQTPAAVQIATPATFGQITSTAIPARLIQFGLKYEF